MSLIDDKYSNNTLSVPFKLISISVSLRVLIVSYDIRFHTFPKYVKKKKQSTLK